MTATPDRLRAEHELIEAQDRDREVPPGVRTPRQRLATLSADAPFVELGRLARSQQPAAEETTPADGLITGFTRIGGWETAILIEDAKILARTDGQVAEGKRRRILAWAAARGAAIVYVADRPEHAPPTFDPLAGRLFGHLAEMYPPPDLRGHPAPIVAVVAGRCDVDAALLVSAADLVITGRTSFPGDVVANDDDAALAYVRAFLELVPAPLHAPLVRGAPTVPAPLSAECGPREVIAGLLDPAPILWTTGASTAIGRMDGFPVVVSAVGDRTALTRQDISALGRMARLCRRLRLPLLRIQDTAGYVDGAAQDLEFADALRRLNDEVRSSVAPKLGLITGRGHVLGTFALGNRGDGLDYVAAWPGAQVGVRDVEGDQLDAATDGVGDGPWLAAGMGIIDDVIAPAETHERLVHMLEILAPCRSVAPLRESRAGRLVDDIPKL